MARQLKQTLILWTACVASLAFFGPGVLRAQPDPPEHAAPRRNAKDRPADPSGKDVPAGAVDAAVIEQLRRRVLGEMKRPGSREPRFDGRPLHGMPRRNGLFRSPDLPLNKDVDPSSVEQNLPPLPDSLAHSPPAELIASGSAALERGQLLLRQAQGESDRPAKSARFLESRAALDEAHLACAHAAKSYAARLLQPDTASPPPTETSPPQQGAGENAARPQAEISWVDAELKAAGALYLAAQTYEDLDSSERHALLERAAAAFDRVYQLYRNFEVGLQAHLWHGRALADLGDTVTALDVFDEVLAGDSGEASVADELRTLYGQAERARLQLVGQTTGDEAVLKECHDWFKSHKAWQNTDAYCGIQLELAKAELNTAAAHPNLKDKAIQQAMQVLNEVAETESSYKREAVLLRRKVASSQPAAATSSLDDQFALGDEAAERGQWDEAAAAYTEASRQATEAKDVDRAARAEERLADVRLHCAADYFRTGKYDDAIKTAGLVAREQNLATAPVAARLATAAAYALFQASPPDQKPQALERLAKIVNFATANLDGHAETDDARLTLAQACLDQGNSLQALDSLKGIKPGSSRFEAAALAAGRTWRKLYLDERQKPEGERDQAKMQEYRREAESSLRASVEVQPTLPAEETARSRWMESRWLLAELALEGQQPAEAVTLLAQPIALLKETDWQHDQALKLNVAATALRAQFSASQLDQALALSELLLDHGPDSVPLNSLVVESARRLAASVKEDERHDLNPVGLFPSVATTTGNPDASVTQRLSEMLHRLVARQEFSPAAMTQLAELCRTQGGEEDALAISARLVAKAKEDASFRNAGGKSLAAVQLRLVGNLRRKGEYAEAAKQADDLLSSYPTALDALLEKGYVLQAWSKRDPAHCDDCVAHWTQLRRMLEHKQPLPSEYFEAIYAAAECLVTKSRATQKSDSALQAVKLLKSALILHPDLNGPETVVRYQNLLDTTSKMLNETTKPEVKRKPA